MAFLTSQIFSICVEWFLVIVLIVSQTLWLRFTHRQMANIERLVNQNKALKYENRLLKEELHGDLDPR